MRIAIEATGAASNRMLVYAFGKVPFWTFTKYMSKLIKLQYIFS